MIEAITKRLESLALVRHEGLKSEIQYFINLINLINSLDHNHSLMKVVDGIVVNLNEMKLPSVFNGLIYPKSIKAVQEVSYPNLLIRGKLDKYDIKPSQNDKVDLKVDSQNSASSNSQVQAVPDKFDEREILRHNTHVAQFAHYYKRGELEVVSKSISELRTELTLLTSLDRLLISKKCHYTADGTSLPLEVNANVRSFLDVYSFNTPRNEVVLHFVQKLVI